LKTTPDPTLLPAAALLFSSRRRRHFQSVVRWVAGGACLLFFIGAAPAAAKDRDEKKPPPYALIYGTVYGPDDRPLYGVPVKIRRSDKKKAQWELTSDHRGEFAVRVPPGPADYVVWTDAKLPKILGEKAEKPAKASKNKGLDQQSPAQTGVAPTAAAAPPKSIREVKVHVENDERIDMGLHLTE
jgi:hypothetical protein